MILTEPGSGETYLPLESQNELNSEAPIDTPVRKYFLIVI
jgi:hypothetical protein